MKLFSIYGVEITKVKWSRKLGFGIGQNHVSSTHRFTCTLRVSAPPSSPCDTKVFKNLSCPIQCEPRPARAIVPQHHQFLHPSFPEPFTLHDSRGDQRETIPPFLLPSLRPLPPPDTLHSPTSEPVNFSSEAGGSI